LALSVSPTLSLSLSLSPLQPRSAQDDHDAGEGGGRRAGGGGDKRTSNKRGADAVKPAAKAKAAPVKKPKKK
jgi:hypothetical protein